MRNAIDRRKTGEKWNPLQRERNWILTALMPLNWLPTWKTMVQRKGVRSDGVFQTRPMLHLPWVASAHRIHHIDHRHFTQSPTVPI